MEKGVFSANLKKLRIAHGMTQGDMAKILNISRSCIANYESEKRQPDYGMLKIIADYFNVSIDFLVGRSDVKAAVSDSGETMRLRQLDSVLGSSDKLDLRNAEPRVKIALIEFYSYLNTDM